MTPNRCTKIWCNFCFFVRLKSSSFPPKGKKNPVFFETSPKCRQQIDLKAFFFFPSLKGRGGLGGREGALSRFLFLREGRREGRDEGGGRRRGRGLWGGGVVPYFINLKFIQYVVWEIDGAIGDIFLGNFNLEMSSNMYQNLSPLSVPKTRKRCDLKNGTLKNIAFKWHPERRLRFSEASKRGWREGFGDQQPPKSCQKVLQNCVPLLLRGHRKKGAGKGLNLWHRKEFFEPTFSVRQPLFETSEIFPEFLAIFLRNLQQSLRFALCAISKRGDSLATAIFGGERQVSS